MELGFQVLQFDLDLLILSRDFFVLRLMLVRQCLHIVLELLDKILLIPQLLLEHLQILLILLHARVILR